MRPTHKTDDIEAKTAAEQALAKAKELEAAAAARFVRVRIDSKTVILARPEQAELFARQLKTDRLRYH